MSQNILSVKSVTREVLKHIEGIDHELDYNPEQNLYVCPFFSRQGKHMNAFNPSSGFLPKNATRRIKKSANTEKEIAHMAKKAVKKFYNWQKREIGHIVEVTIDQMIGIVEQIVMRFSMGAKAEDIVETKMKNQLCANILPAEPQDEKNGIDIRTNDYLIQVKYSENQKCNWEKPKIDEYNKKSILLWVDNNSIVRKHLHNDKRGMDKYTQFLK